MSIVAVIAEYNPFHNGHKYLIEQAKKLTDADKVIAIMSGDFTQRGVPAMADKYARAESAIIGGVDAVFELPCLYATGSARDFAIGAVGIINRLNCVDYLVFGAENPEQEIFETIAEILATEPEEYKTCLSKQLAKGLSYPAASQNSIQEYMNHHMPEGISGKKDIHDIILKPNNILAISYLTALRMNKSKIKPIIVQRSDEGYLNVSLSGKYSSAASIRMALEGGEDVSTYVPSKCLKPFKKYQNLPLPSPDWMSPYIASRLIYDRNLTSEENGLENIMDMTPELLNRLRKAPLPIKHLELSDFLKTRNVTMTRVSRVILHLLLGITVEDREMAKSQGYSEYINLLALRKTSSEVINIIKESSNLTIINKKSEYQPATDLGERMWQIDKLATDFYNQLIYENINLRLHNELTSSVKTV
ncbi:MAG: nucleotidyltransferase family protein [Eubacterium sp.]|nr:nucleotidyltransferase family protein [Eubacterium sp.]